MVKRHSKTGRRQILQLEDKKPPPGPVFKPSRSIIHYSDSDEDSKISDDCPPGTQSASGSAPLDSQVEDFLKEIDAMTEKESPGEGQAEAEASQPVNASQMHFDGASSSFHSENGGSSTAVNNRQPVTAHEGAYCAWQAISDDSTGYNYYWNMETNEVTWDCPPEYIQYLNFINSAAQNNSAQQPTHPATSQSTSHSILKKQKVKKDVGQLKEGSVIPISYFGGSSSSEDSSDNESRISCSSKRTKKDESGRYSRKKLPQRDKKETSESIGPQLPPNFHFPENIPLSPRSTLTVQSTSQSPRNEVEEFVEIGPKLPIDIATEKAASVYAADSNNDVENVPAVSQPIPDISEDENPSQSTVNTDPVESTQKEDSWEESLHNIEMQFKDLKNAKQEADIPDSTTKKEDASKSYLASPLQTNSSIHLSGLVAGYDSFTDEEDEEMDMENISSSDNIVHSGTTLKDETSEAAAESEVDDFLNSEKPQVEKHAVNNNSEDAVGSTSQKPQKFKDNPYFQPSCSKSHKTEEKHSSIDIDSLFATHSSSGKFGFGFSKKPLVDDDDDDFCSSSSQSYASPRRRNNYKKVSFVKSNQALDLTVLNKDLETQSSKIEDSKEEKKILPDDIQPEELKVKESPTVESEEPDANRNILSAIKKDIASRRKNKVPEPVSVCDMDIEIDEIDKALSDALEEKKMADSNTAKPSTSTQDPFVDTEPSIPSIKPKTEQENLDSTKDVTITAQIVDLSSELMDKLTFILSNDSAMSSYSGLLIQIQTRLVDWQANALGSQYFLSRLQETNQYLQQYEQVAVTGDWTCQWDRNNKRYFYMNSRTQHSQWTFPGEPASQPKPTWIASSEIPTTNATTFPISGTQFPLVSSSMADQQQHTSVASAPFPKVEPHSQDQIDHSPSSPLHWESQSSPPPPPPGVDSPPPPPPPQTPPIQSPPPLPPDSTEIEEGELPQDMDLEDSSSSDSIPFQQNIELGGTFHMSAPYMTQHISDCTSTSTQDQFYNSAHNISSTSVAMSERPLMIAQTPQPIVGNTPIWFPPPVQKPIMGSNLTQNVGVWCPPASTMPLESSERSAIEASVPSTSSNIKAVASTSGTGSITKKEKKKTKLTAGLALKKKNINSLVQKWQKIKKEQDKVFKDSDDSQN